MSYTDPCARCGYTRANCECAEKGYLSCMPDTKTDKHSLSIKYNEIVSCTSSEGMTIGLIDAILSIVNVLKERDLDESREVQNALMDLSSNKDLKHLQDIGFELQTLSSLEAVGD